MIRFENVSKVYAGNEPAVSGVSFEVVEGETLVLLGTSGSGKTTLLKMVNRLIEPTAGSILIEEQDIMAQDPVQLRRRIGYAIQHVGLFPHMTIAENIAIVPGLLKWPRHRIQQQTDRLLSMTGLAPETFRHRYPHELSGGQRQRVGVARALAANPPIILMDEPFGALDPITREKLQDEFIELEADIKKTVLFVTHDIFEAVKMADRIALIDRGALQQIATPAQLVEQPASEFVTAFLGRHRLQLYLLTKKLKDIIRPEQNSPGSTARPDLHLDADTSLIGALDMFRETGRDVLPVFAGQVLLGSITRKRLQEVIAESMCTACSG